MFKLLRRLIGLFLAVIVLSTSFVYTYWVSFGSGSAQTSLDINVDFDYNDDITDALDVPGFIPEQVKDIVEGWKGVKDPQVIYEIVNTLVRIYEYIDFNGAVHLESTLDDFFSGGNNLSVGANDYIIYTVGSGEDTEVMVVHTSAAYNFSSPENFMQRLNELWNNGSHIRPVSQVWMRGKYYTFAHAPVEYTHNGVTNFYYFQNSNNRNDPPPLATSSWHIISQDYVSTNIYPLGSIVRHNGRYFRAANGVTWGNNAPSSWPWVEVHRWSSSTNYQVGGNIRNTVYTNEPDGSVRFWEVMRPNSNSFPSEDNCKSPNGALNGNWREVDNAWTGRNQDYGTPKTYYKDYNTYNQNEIVVYGVEANLRYRFYIARTFVPDGQPPLIRNESNQLEVNSAYWTRWE